MTWVAVLLGGAFGSAARYGVNLMTAIIGPGIPTFFMKSLTASPRRPSASALVRLG